MWRYFNSVILLLISLAVLFGQESSQDSILSDTQISLITCDPGGDLYSLFGHSAVRVFNKDRHYDVVYNYGTFDFNTPGFMVKFMRGKLPYKLSAYKYEHFLMEYHHDHRGVREQVINLEDAEKANFISFLENNALPQNALYKYDFFYDNCSTRIREALEKSLPMKANYTSKEDVTFRDLLHQYLTGHAWTALGIDMIIGSRADIKANATHQQFLPDKMHDILSDVTYKGKKLMEKSNAVLNFDEDKEARKVNGYWHPILVNILLGILVIYLFYSQKYTWFNRIFGVWKCIASFAAILILLLWFVTDHTACRDNWNIIWLSPLYLLLFIGPLKENKYLLMVLIIGSVIALLNHWLPIIPQDMPTISISFFLILLIGKYYLAVYKKPA